MGGQLSFSLFAEPLIIISVQLRRWHAIVCQLGEPAGVGASPFLKGDGPSKSFLVLKYHPPLRERAFPTRKGPSQSCSPPNHQSSSPEGTGLTPHKGGPQKGAGSQGALSFFEAGNQGGQLAPIAVVGFVR